MQEYQILIIEDDEVLSGMLCEYLADEGFQIDTKADGLEGLNQATAKDYALIILDVMLPTLGGFEILKRLRAKSSVPVLMLTARGDDVDRIVGLEIGADDYLPKPFNTRELVARMRAILRRTSKSDTNENTVWSIGGLQVDIENWQASFQGSEIELTSAEFRILDKLYEQLGTPVTRAELTEYSLGRPMHDLDRSIDTHVSNLRKKLQSLKISSVKIKSVRNIGYTMVKTSRSSDEEE